MEGTERAQSCSLLSSQDCIPVLKSNLDMEEAERAQPFYSCLNRTVDQSCRVISTWKGLSRAQPVYFCLNRIVYE